MWDCKQRQKLVVRLRISLEGARRVDQGQADARKGKLDLCRMMRSFPLQFPCKVLDISVIGVQ